MISAFEKQAGRIRILRDLFVVALLLPASTLTPAFARSVSFEFVGLEPSARSASMGGALAAVPEDASAVSYNPAGLAWLSRGEVSFMHNEYFQTVRQEHLQAAFRGDWGGLGLAGQYISYGSFQQTTLSQPRGTGETIRPNSFLATLAYGGKAVRFLSLGAALKVGTFSLGPHGASAAALDFGALYEAPVKEMRLAASLQNIGTRIRFLQTNESWPLLLRLGGSYRFLEDRLLAALEFDIAKDREDTIHLGVEYRPLSLLSLRAGYNGTNQAGIGLTAGVGLQVSSLRFDYGFAPFGDLGLAHRASLSYRFGRKF